MKTPEHTDIQSQTMEELAAERGFEIIVLRQDRTSSNKFLGSHNQRLGATNFKGEARRGGRNSNGYDPTVKKLANALEEHNGPHDH